MMEREKVACGSSYTGPLRRTRQSAQSVSAGLLPRFLKKPCFLKDTATTELYTVKRYDTLWSIASSHYSGDPRAAIYRLEERNDLAGDVVQPGQKLVLP